MKKLTAIEAGRRWRIIDLSELWRFRELLWVLTLRDVKVRYKQTILGIAWAVIQPTLMMVIFSLVFGRLAKIPSDGVPYPIFVYSALLPWTFFANSVGNAGNSLVASSNLVRKVYFYRLIIPLSSVGAGLIDFVFAFIILLLMMIYYGVGWSLNLLFAPFLLFGIALTALGVGVLLSALNVAYRDFRYVIPFLVQIWMFVTPVVYPVSVVPEKWRWLLYLNPMSGFIDGFRSAFLGRPYDVHSLLVAAAVSVGVLIAGVVYFGKVERKLADII